MNENHPRLTAAEQRRPLRHRLLNLMLAATLSVSTSQLQPGHHRCTAYDIAHRLRTSLHSTRRDDRDISTVGFGLD